MGLPCKKHWLPLALLVHCPALVDLCICTLRPGYVAMLICDETTFKCKGQLLSVLEAGTDRKMEIMRQRLFVNELCTAPII